MLTLSHRWKKCTRAPGPADRQVSEEAGYTAQTFPSAPPGDAHEAELLLLENRTLTLPPSQPPSPPPAGTGLLRFQRSLKGAF